MHQVFYDIDTIDKKKTKGWQSNVWYCPDCGRPHYGDEDNDDDIDDDEYCSEGEECDDCDDEDEENSMVSISGVTICESVGTLNLCALYIILRGGILLGPRHRRCGSPIVITLSVRPSVCLSVCPHFVVT